jgi:hypothetical protein
VCPEKNRARQVGCPIKFKHDEPMDAYAALICTEPNSTTMRKIHETIIVNDRSFGGQMNKKSLETIARRRHRREKSTIDHLADKVYGPQPAAKDLKEPMTDQGLPIEEQVRKTWDPKKGGLPIF